MPAEFRFASTFPAGFEEGVQDALKSRDPQVRTDVTQDGLVIYTSQMSPEAIRNLPFLNNTFLVLNQMHFQDTSNTAGIVDSLFRKVRLNQFKGVVQSLGAHTFRLMVSKENQTQSISPSQRERIETTISKSLRLHVNRDNPGVEFWFLSRRDGTSFCGLRLTRREKTEKGELGREISYLLNLVSEPNKKDVFLDPFAGSGAIPFSRAKYFPYSEVIAVDTDPKMVAGVKHRLKRFQRTETLQGDVLKMKDIQNESIDVIVTDPPWGFFEKFSIDPNTFHLKMLQEFGRVLKPGGRAVILTARTEEIEGATGKLGWHTEKVINVLVSGKKANIYYLKKSEHK